MKDILIDQIGLCASVHWRSRSYATICVRHSQSAVSFPCAQGSASVAVPRTAVSCPIAPTRRRHPHTQPMHAHGLVTPPSTGRFRCIPRPKIPSQPVQVSPEVSLKERLQTQVPQWPAGLRHESSIVMVLASVSGMRVYENVFKNQINRCARTVGRALQHPIQRRVCGETHSRHRGVLGSVADFLRWTPLIQRDIHRILRGTSGTE